MLVASPPTPPHPSALRPNPNTPASQASYLNTTTTTAPTTSHSSSSSTSSGSPQQPEILPHLIKRSASLSPPLIQNTTSTFNVHLNNSEDSASTWSSQFSTSVSTAATARKRCSTSLSPDSTKLLLHHSNNIGSRSPPTSATSATTALSVAAAVNAVASPAAAPFIDVGVVNSLLLLKQQQLLKQQLQHHSSHHHQVSPPLSSTISGTIPPIAALSSSSNHISSGGGLGGTAGGGGTTPTQQQLHEYQLQQQQMLHAAYHRQVKQQQQQQQQHFSHYFSNSKSSGDLLSSNNSSSAVGAVINSNTAVGAAVNAAASINITDSINNNNNNNSNTTSPYPSFTNNLNPTPTSMSDPPYPPTPTPTVSTASTNSTSTTPTITNNNTNNSTPPLTTPPSSTSSSGAASGGANLAAHHPLLGYVPHGANKILSRNLNGTLAVTTQPSNESELQLYRVLQRANLLTYYDVFISQGGDDVQQLCEAGEEEFLEIMALVGMASKPLHVRRLQKALQEWVTNPPLFQIPLLPNLPPSVVAGFSYSTRGSTPSTPSGGAPLTPTRPSPPVSNHLPSTLPSSSPGIKDSAVPPPPPPPPSSRPLDPSPLPPSFGGSAGISRGSSPTGPNSSITHQSMGALDRSPPEMLPHMLKLIMGMTDNDPRRMEEIRKYAAIYGRFDCKRKAEKPLTLHEVSVNEAAAQICKYMPALLTRRDELFPLARQVVRDSGYQYSKGHSRSQTVVSGGGRDEDQPRVKRSRLESDSTTTTNNTEIKGEMTWEKKQKRLEQIGEELRQMSEKAEEVRNSLTNGTGDVLELTAQMEALQQRHGVLTIEQNDLMKDLRCGPPDDRTNDDTDSHLSFSGDSSPSQVVSSSQGNIIAVTNPALSQNQQQLPVSNNRQNNNSSSTANGEDEQTTYKSASSPSTPIKQEPGSPTPAKH